MTKGRSQHLPAIVACACVVALVALGLLSGLLDVGDRLMRLSPVLGWLYYALVIALVTLGIVVPVARVASRPVFALWRLRDERGRSRMRWCRKLATNLRTNVELTDEQRARLDAAFELEGDGSSLAPDHCADELAALYREVCVPRMDARIKKTALGACAATAISQTAVYDALSMLALNVSMVRDLVEECGFRPSTPQLVRVYVRVLGAGLLAGGIEELDLEEILPSVLGQASAKVPGVLVASTTQGIVNAFTTYRIGVLTKRYLLDETGPTPVAEARRASYGEALALMKQTGFYGEAMRMVSEKVGQAGDAAWESVKTSVKSTVETAVRTTGVDSLVAKAGSGLSRLVGRGRGEGAGRLAGADEPSGADEADEAGKLEDAGTVDAADEAPAKDECLTEGGGELGSASEDDQLAAQGPAEGNGRRSAQGPAGGSASEDGRRRGLRFPWSR